MKGHNPYEFTHRLVNVYNVLLHVRMSHTGLHEFLPRRRVPSLISPNSYVSINYNKSKYLISPNLYISIIFCLKSQWCVFLHIGPVPSLLHFNCKLLFFSVVHIVLFFSKWSCWCYFSFSGWIYKSWCTLTYQMYVEYFCLCAYICMDYGTLKKSVESLRKRTDQFWKCFNFSATVSTLST